MAVQDAIQKWFDVGDIVLVPCRVTAIGGTSTQPNVTLSTKYVGWDGNADTVSVDTKQVIKDE
jgi:hypothetical protein